MRISTAQKKCLLEEVRLRVREGFAFHNVAHAEDVHAAVCQILSHYPSIAPARFVEFEMAALLHDIAYCDGADGHELRGCVLAKEILLRQGLSSEVAGRVGELILDTTVTLKPQTLDAKIMRDADVFHIGSAHGKTRSFDFWQEQLNQGRAISRDEWCRSEIRFLRQQHFFLDWLEAERASGREAAIREMENAVGIIR